MTVPKNAKRPSDRKPKAAKKEPLAERFVFQCEDGETIELAVTAEAVSPGFIRKNRDASPPSFLYGMLEQCATEDQLDEIDNMSWSENKKFLNGFEAHMEQFLEVSLGE